MGFKHIAGFVFLSVLLPIVGAGQQKNEKEVPEPPLKIRIDVPGRLPDEASSGTRSRKKGQWLELRSRNFHLVGDASESDIRQAASELELFRSQFANLFPRAKETSSVATRVVVFKDGGGVREYMPAGEGVAQVGRGYLQPSPDLNYIVLPGGAQPGREVLREYARLLMRDSLAPVPAWFQVGVLEYFDTYRLMRMGNDRVIKLGLDERKGNPKQTKLFPLATLFSADAFAYEFADEDSRRVFAAESCALVSYLVQSQRLGAAVRFLSSMSSGRSMETSFREAFKLPLASFEDSFKNNIKTNRLHGWRVTFAAWSLDPEKGLSSILYANDGARRVPTSFDTVRAEVESTPGRLLSEAEEEYFRGDLLLHAGRVEDAAARLLHATELDSELAPAYASLGRMQAIQGRYTDARETLDAAIALDRKGYLAYYYAARMIQDEAAAKVAPLGDRDIASIRALLTRSVSLAPFFAEASEMLAESHLAHRGGDTRLASALLVNGLRYSPGRESLRVKLANVAVAGNDRPLAEQMLGTVLSGTDPVATRDAEELLRRLSEAAPQSAASAQAPAAGTVVRVSLSSGDIGKKLKPAPGEETKVVRGNLSGVDCGKELTLYIQLGEVGIDFRTENLRTGAPSSVEWVSDRGEEIEAIECSRRIRPRPAAITYRPKRKGLTMGEPLIVELITFTD